MSKFRKVPLTLNRIAIENYRSCLRTSMDLHPNLSVLIGPNSSGKTNILQAIMLLNKMAQEEHYRASDEGAIPVTFRIKSTFQQGRNRILLRAAANAYTDESNNDVMLDSRQRWSLNQQKIPFTIPLSFVTHFGSNWAVEMPRYFHRVRGMFQPLRKTLTSSLPEGADRALSAVGKFCLEIRYYGASQFTNPGSCPVSFEIEEEGTRRRLIRPHGHTKILNSMYSAWKAESNNRFARFIDIVGPHGLRLIDGLRFQEQPTSSMEYSVRVGGRLVVRKRHKLLVIPQFSIGRQKLSPNQLSEGTFKTLALLFHVITEDSTALLIEEPEVCVHHGLLTSILELIKSYSRNTQMIISTHSDYVLDHVEPENVYRVSFDKSTGTVVRHIRKTMSSKEFGALRHYLDQEGNLGEYWREGGLGDRP